MMKRPMIILSVAAACGLLSSCATKSDPMFMNNASSAINGGMMQTPAGAVFAPGVQTPTVHPFFGGARE